MNQITLYRKGGRKPWVFERKEVLFNGYYAHRAADNKTYWINLNNTGVDIGIWGEPVSDAPEKIHADHFKLGNVTITFD